jgi:hypothetical protein
MVIQGYEAFLASPLARTMFCVLCQDALYKQTHRAPVASEHHVFGLCSLGRRFLLHNPHSPPPPGAGGGGAYPPCSREGVSKIQGGMDRIKLDLWTSWELVLRCRHKATQRFTADRVSWTGGDRHPFTCVAAASHVPCARSLVGSFTDHRSAVSPLNPARQ